MRNPGNDVILFSKTEDTARLYRRWKPGRGSFQRSRSREVRCLSGPKNKTSHTAERR